MNRQKLLNNLKISLALSGKVGEITKIKPLLYDAQVKIVDGCNSRCETCDIWKKRTNKEMSINTYSKVLDELKSCGLRSVGITGGEPLLHSNIVDICKITKNKCLNLTIATNGLLLSKKIDMIAAYVDCLSISIDGIGKTNDKIRGVTGYYKNVTNSILDIRKRHPQIVVSISTTITNSNFNEIEKLLKWCKKNRVTWSANLLMNSLYFFRKAKIKDLQVKESIDNIIKFKKMLLDYRDRRVVNISKVSIDYLANFLKGKQKPAPCVLGLIFGFVDCDANYYTGCWALPPIGNLNKMTMSEIINSKKFKERIGNMHKLKCPGCTCGYDQNWKINNYWRHLQNRVKEIIEI